MSKLIYKKINFEYKATMQLHLSENKSFEDSFLLLIIVMHLVYSQNKQAIDNLSKGIHVLE
jgi:hypothetical protein